MIPLSLYWHAVTASTCSSHRLGINVIAAGSQSRSAVNTSVKASARLPEAIPYPLYLPFVFHVCDVGCHSTSFPRISGASVWSGLTASTGSARPWSLMLHGLDRFTGRATEPPANVALPSPLPKLTQLDRQGVGPEAALSCHDNAKNAIVFWLILHSCRAFLVTVCRHGDATTGLQQQHDGPCLLVTIVQLNGVICI